MRKQNRNVVAEFKIRNNQNLFVEHVISRYLTCGPAGADSVRIVTNHKKGIIKIVFENVTNTTWIKKLLNAIQYTTVMWDVAIDCKEGIESVYEQLQQIQNEKTSAKRTRDASKKVSRRSTSSDKQLQSIRVQPLFV